jgi:acetylornithine/succinyldiaminopimelate/putrescine aminotransferase
MHKNSRKYLAQLSSFEAMHIEVDRAEGLYIFDKKGKKYLDLHSGICVNNLGHRHPVIMEALRKQSEKHLHVNVYGECIQEIQLAFARKLIALLGNPFEQCFLLSSGSEAIDAALKTAKMYTGRRDIVSFAGSYHGSTQSLMGLLGDEKYKRPFRPLIPGYTVLKYNDTSQLDQINSNTAAVLLELIQTASGMPVIQDAFLKELRKRCDETGTLLIFDEIQTSLGRCGTIFGFQHFGVKPDIICLAKSLGGGLPLSAFAASDTIMDSLNKDHPLLGHASTFGGNPLACASGLATLEYLEAEDICKDIPEKELLFREKLKDSRIREIQGRGLLLALYPDSRINVKKYLERIIDKGLISNTFLFEDGAVALTPPLLISEEEIGHVCQILLSELG